MDILVTANRWWFGWSRNNFTIITINNSNFFHRQQHNVWTTVLLYLHDNMLLCFMGLEENCWLKTELISRPERSYQNLILPSQSTILTRTFYSGALAVGKRIINPALFLLPWPVLPFRESRRGLDFDTRRLYLCFHEIPSTPFTRQKCRAII